MIETIRMREVEFLNYLRNSIIDTEGRGSTEISNLVGDGVQTDFELPVAQVKNIKSITVNAVEVYIGHHYIVELGEGSQKTIIKFRTAPPDTHAIVVTYHVGETIIYEGYQRLDSTLPRMSLIFRGTTRERIAIGDAWSGQDGHFVYEEGSYTCEIRTYYANQMKSLMHSFANIVEAYRQITPQPYGMIDVVVTMKQPFDFDNDLRVYRAQVSFLVKWIVKFK